MNWYILTLDSHTTIGPFASHMGAIHYAVHTDLRSFEVLHEGGMRKYELASIVAPRKGYDRD